MSTPNNPAARDRRSVVGRTTFDPALGLQLALLGDVAVRALIWMLALAITLWWGAHNNVNQQLVGNNLYTPAGAFRLARGATQMLIAFNLAYLLVLLALRLLIPRPRSGRYPLPRPANDWNLIWAGLAGVLTRARYQPPFPAFLVPQLAGLLPFRFLFGILGFGPRSQSSFWAEPICLDPSEITIGRNVGIGYGCILAGHLVSRDAIEFAPTRIEDDVFIGGNAVIPGGVHIQRGAVIGLGSYLTPGTVVGANEFWAGIPARKIKDLPPLDHPPAPPA